MWSSHIRNFPPEKDPKCWSLEDLSQHICRGFEPWQPPWPPFLTHAGPLRYPWHLWTPLRNHFFHFFTTALSTCYRKPCRFSKILKILNYKVSLVIFAAFNTLVNVAGVKISPWFLAFFNVLFLFNLFTKELFCKHVLIIDSKYDLIRF